MEAPDHGDSHAPTKPHHSVPSLVWGALLATLAACAFVIEGFYLIDHSGGGCDGGTCGVAFYVGIVKAMIALVLGLPIGSLLIAGVRRVLRFWYVPAFWLKRK